MMKKFFQYFGFNEIEQRGFIVFTGFILLVLSIPFIVKSLRSNDYTHYNIVYFESSPSAQGNYVQAEHSKNTSDVTKFDNNRAITYFFFDPNNLDRLSWSKLGFSDKQIDVIKNYEAKGGRFYTKKDVAKIYVISERDYARIEPYIKIENKGNFMSTNLNASTGNVNNYKTSIQKNIAININKADTTAWKSLVGIGSVLSKRIVKYREALGGFYAIDQLREVYGLTADTFDKIIEYLILDDYTIFNKLAVNVCTMHELARHPYINREQAQAIVNYRNQHGFFDNLENLSKIKSLDSDFLRKIELYLEY